MKKLRKIKFFVSLFGFMCFVGTYSQTNYKITYKIAEPKMQGSQKNLDDNGREFFTKVFRKAKTIRYQLITNGQESYFEEVKALNTGNESPLDEIAHKMAKRFASFNEKGLLKHENRHYGFFKIIS